MKKTLILVSILTLLLVANSFAQIPVIRESNRQEIAQVVGDSKITIVYHRPNVKGRANIYGCQSTDVIPKGGVTYPCLVPNGQVWRTGANENTTIEFSTDVTINGQPLPAGKYGFFAIPNDNDWTLIFNKVNNEWGSFTYKADQDALRVKTVPVKTSTSRDTLMYEFDSISANSTKVILSWEKLQVPFTVSVGDINARVVGKIREAIKARAADDVRPLNQGAAFVFGNKMSANYDEAIGWLDESIKVKETFANLNAKARILAEKGNKTEAIATAEKALQVGKASTPAPSANALNALEGELKKWKGQ